MWARFDPIEVQRMAQSTWVGGDLEYQQGDDDGDDRGRHAQTPGGNQQEAPGGRECGEGDPEAGREPPEGTAQA
jgi:hypothetical protein